MDFHGFKSDYNQIYISSMRPVFNKRGLFSDTTADYVIPNEPSPYEEITIKFRTSADNVDKVYFVPKNAEKMQMYKMESDGEFDYYECQVQLENEVLSYHFEIIAGKIKGVYDFRGFQTTEDDSYNYTILPGFKTPDWAKGAVMYQIYVDRFCNGDKTNDVQTDEYNYIGEHVHRVDDWYRYPASMDVREFYGGDLQGVLDKMDYLEDLGVEVIYFNPLFVSPSNHKYDIQDYDYIDPHIGKIVNEQGDLLSPGDKDNSHASKYINRVANKENLEASNQLFIKVVEEAHKRGMKVILDGVFNHCGSFNKWMDRERIYENFPGYEKGAHVSADSPYRNYFGFYGQNWPYNREYDGWWGHDTLPKLNYEGSRELYDYILRVGAKWVSPPFNADGWRLDVAADLGHSPEFNHQFWRDFRKAVKRANPEAVILAEHYGSTKAWLQGDQWDTVMNYDAFMEPITWFLTGMEKHSDDFRGDLLGNADSFWGAMRRHSSDFSGPSLQTAMNELSNHDHSRFLTRTNRRVGRTNTLGPEAASMGINHAVFREAVVMQMTWPGAPTIYYGDEAGLCGFTDPDNRRTYPWGREDQEMIQFHKDIIKIHKSIPALKTGSLRFILGEYNLLVYGRFNREQQCVVIINNNDHEIDREVRVWPANIPRTCKVKRIMITYDIGYNTEEYEYEVHAGRVKVTMPKYSSMILYHETDWEEEED